MTDLLQPFVGYIPASNFGNRVVGPPSATLTNDQKKAATGDPLSFRQTAGRKAGCSTRKARKWLDGLLDDGVLLETGPGVIVYRQEAGDFVAEGFIADLSLDAYRSGRVKRHEKTIAKTQKKMAEYMQTTRLYGNPPVTASRTTFDAEAAISQLTSREPASTFTTVDEIKHQLWVVGGDEAHELCRHIDTELFITDGHHRLAAAGLVANKAGRIPVGVFSANEFRLRSFARCITDPKLKAGAAIKELRAEFELEEVAMEDSFPRSRFEFGAKIGDRYFRLLIPDDHIPADHYGSLNTNLIQDLVLGPIFGITRPRSDERLRFVANLDDLGGLCDKASAWFLPYPLEVSDVMTVASSDRTMPAKSTWFAPKLPSGLVIRPLDQ